MEMHVQIARQGERKEIPSFSNKVEINPHTSDNHFNILISGTFFQHNLRLILHRFLLSVRQCACACACLCVCAFRLIEKEVKMIGGICFLFISAGS